MEPPQAVHEARHLSLHQPGGVKAPATAAPVVVIYDARDDVHGGDAAGRQAGADPRASCAVGHGPQQGRAACTASLRAQQGVS